MPWAACVAGRWQRPAGISCGSQKAHLLLLACSAAVAVMGLSLWLRLPPLVSYAAITLMSFAAMGASTLFMVQIYTLVQVQTPPQLVGKVMAALISIAMCGQRWARLSTACCSTCLPRILILCCWAPPVRRCASPFAPDGSSAGWPDRPTTKTVIFLAGLSGSSLSKKSRPADMCGWTGHYGEIER